MHSISFLILSLFIAASSVDPSRPQSGASGVVGNLKGSSTSSSLDLGTSTTEAPHIIISDEWCTEEVRSKYRWARWIIMFGVAVLFALFLLPLIFCTSCLSGLGKFTMMGGLLLLMALWLVFAIMADSSIYKGFDFVFRDLICE